MKDIYYGALLHSLGITHKKFHAIFAEGLWKHEGCYQDFYKNMSFSQLRSYKITEKDAEKIMLRKSTISIDSIIRALDERSVEVISIYDEAYPKELKNISQIPYLLYIRGTLGTEPKVAVVGARKITSYGSRVIEQIIPEVSKYFTIVSGGAFGCDTTAHNQTLLSGNITVSVIGTSICEDYPTGNKKMYDSIVDTGGAVISIFPIGVPGNAYNFPIRNEIVAGLSIGVLVVEAQEKSGSLITSKLALDLGKDLFAIPGEIFKSNSAGCNMLIKNGEAKLVNTALDILEEYNFNKQSSHAPEVSQTLNFSDPLQKKIYECLLLEGFTSDELTKKLDIDISTLSLQLTMLELMGYIKKSLGGKFEVK